MANSADVEFGVAVSESVSFLSGATGTGFSPNLREAARWFERAAVNGHATAAFNIAVFYLNGSGVKKDPVAAITWFEKASEAGGD